MILKNVKNTWTDGFLDKEPHKNYLKYWAEHIIQDSGGSKGQGGWPYISELFLLSQEILNESQPTDAT